jgi:hypothetical protein
MMLVAVGCTGTFRAARRRPGLVSSTVVCVGALVDARCWCPPRCWRGSERLAAKTACAVLVGQGLRDAARCWAWSMERGAWSIEHGSISTPAVGAHIRSTLGDGGHTAPRSPAAACQRPFAHSMPPTKGLVPWPRHHRFSICTHWFYSFRMLQELILIRFVRGEFLSPALVSSRLSL